MQVIRETPEVLVTPEIMVLEETEATVVTQEIPETPETQAVLVTEAEAVEEAEAEHSRLKAVLPETPVMPLPAPEELEGMVEQEQVLAPTLPAGRFHYPEMQVEQELMARPAT